ncbi:peptidoglycan-binding protein [Pantanalinema rosaneae CENA516]|uniref:peptidoglycan-binding protein n=1 Tax=Pantanalinema rosaneae TaxID=1620701 RepID=UPI003D6E3C0A
MELLAFVHTAANYENPASDPEVRLFDGVSWKIPSSAWIGLAGVAVTVATVGGSPETALAATNTVVAPGSSGAEVEAVQTALGIEADGQYGAQTTAAVTDFQLRQGLKQVDGIVGKETATALGLDENYRPVSYGFADTNYGSGVNIRSGPGLDYRIIGGAPDGSLLNVDYYNAEYRDGYVWTPVSSGGWIAADYVDYYGEYRPVGYYDDYYYYNGYYPTSSDCYDDWDYSPVSSYSGRVDTRSNIGLNVRSGPGLGYGVVDGYSEGSYVYSGGGPVYRDGYTWVETSNGWVASDYLY